MATLRSERMASCDVFIQPEAAFETMSQLGDMGRVQFMDMNTEVAPYHKSYINEVCRCYEMDRKLKYLEGEMLREKIYIAEPTINPKPIQPSEMVMYENLFEKWENDIMEITQNEAKLRQDLLEMKELRYVLTHIGPMLGDVDRGMETIAARNKMGGGDISGYGRLIVITGVVKRAKCFTFELMLWRISRGNIYYRQAARDQVLTDPYSRVEIRKVAFVAVCQGEMLSSRMEKVMSGYRVNLYPCPEKLEDRVAMLENAEIRITELEEVLRKSYYYRCKSLRVIGKQWKTWMIQVRKTKAIYHNMNLLTLDITKKCLIGQCWVPVKDVKKVQDTLQFCSSMMQTNVPSFLSKVRTDAEPPTYYRKNKFTDGFQALIDAYGDSKYRELNPAIFSVVTFPFLFAVMFGDAGHALILIVFGAWMILTEKKYMDKASGEIWSIFFGGRYVILLLGLFSLYTGFVYNDFFSKPLNLYSSMWRNTLTEDQLKQEQLVQLGASSRLRRPYPFGMDPIWMLLDWNVTGSANVNGEYITHVPFANDLVIIAESLEELSTMISIFSRVSQQMSNNKIMIENSVKMKMSIIIGVLHMMFGIVLSFFNHLHFKKYYAVFFQFIPQLTFLTCIFFWLVILIYYKWFIFWDGHNDATYNSACAPQILILFIDMVLYAGTTIKPLGADCEVYMFSQQKTMQLILMCIALLCIPVLLFGTPVYLYSYHNKKMMKIYMVKYNIQVKTQFRRYQRDSDDIFSNTAIKKTATHVEAQIAKYSAPFSELMILQAVHTIEFILSTISHTASYLRLWALSLAHAQLSEMLWVMILSTQGLQDHSSTGFIKIFFAFAVWAAFTVGILVVMEGLSAFLHTLRLHWVEFMSKFFIGGGYPFQPFSFKTILAAERDKVEGACKTSVKTRLEKK